MAAEHESLPLPLRSATVDDLGEIIDLDRRSFSQPWTRQMLIDELSGENKYFLCAFLPNRETALFLLGFICFHCCLDESTLIRIAVDPGSRRQGIASFLIREMIRRLRNKHIKEIFLEVGASNHAVRILYRSFDFQPIGRRPDYYAGTREDALIMKATL